MAQVSVLGIDIAKQLFHVVGMENLLGNVDPQYPKILFHRTRLLWSNDFTWR